MNPAAIQQKLQQALVLHQSNRLDEAEQIYRQVLQVQPNHPDGLNLLGLLLLSRGQLDEAQRLIERAVQINPKSALFHLHLGNVHQAAGRMQQAIQSWRQAASLAPDLIDAKINLATAYMNAGDFAAAEPAWREVVRAAPMLPDPQFHLGHVRLATNRFAEAAEALSACVRLDPTRFAALDALGVALSRLGRHAEAADALVKAAQLAPQVPAVQVNLGWSLRSAGNPVAAEQAFRTAIDLSQAALSSAYHGLAVALREQSRAAEAQVHAREAIRLAPELAPRHHALGNILYDLGHVEEALEAYRRSLELDPNDARVRTGLLLILHYRHGNQPQMLFDEHREWGRRHADTLTPDITKFHNDRNLDRRLRIGYVSPDLYAHPVTFFFEPILEAHDKSAEHVSVFSSTAAEDEFTGRLRRHADAWHDVRPMSDDDLAAFIRDQQIDVLVDLSGHIADNRLLTFARKPAPVQVTYLGYPDTTGMRAMDYRLTDAWHDPPAATDQFHTEKLIRLPGGAWCYRQRDQMPPVSPLPAESSGYVTFFSPNKIAKVTDEMLALWREILLRVPQSRLIVLTGGDEAGAQRVRSAMQQIDPARLELIGRTSVENYFNLYRRSDITLDTFPYNGHTTSCDSLWMGVPVITLAGQTHVTRAGVSLLSKLSLEQFIATTPQQYIDRAVAAAQDINSLRELRATMRDRINQRGLTDGRRLAREFEAAFRDMWRQWCEQNH